MKAKRLVALLMALVIVVGLLSMTAAAAGVPGPNCGSRSHNCLSDQTYTYFSYVYSCPRKNSPHNHEVTRVYDAYTCKTCGHYWEDIIRSPYKYPYASQNEIPPEID